jgi:hypothetical protein
MTRRPEFANGQLMPSIYDDVFKHLASDAQMWTGDVETVGWYVSEFHIDREDIRRAVSVTGNPRASEAGAIGPGWYLTLIDEQGLIWAYYYGQNLTLSHDDFGEATEAYEISEGYTDDVIVDYDENGNVIEPDDDEDEE